MESSEFLRIKAYYRRQRLKQDEILLAEILKEQEKKYHEDKHKKIEELREKLETLTN